MLIPMFYWLSIALAALVIAWMSYVWITDLTIQALMFAVLSGLFSYLIPKYLKSDIDIPYGMSAYIWTYWKIKILDDNTYKVILDGVEYNFILSNDTDKLKNNELVLIEEFNGSEFIWKKKNKKEV